MTGVDPKIVDVDPVRRSARTRQTADYATMRTADSLPPAPIPALPVAGVWDHVDDG